MPLVDRDGGGRSNVRLADVAERAGVSRALASLVIREAPGPSAASREAVLRAAAELGYRPHPAAQLLRQHRSRLVGVLFDPGDPFHADLLEALYPAADDDGYELVLAATVPSRSPQRSVDGLISSRCEGLLLIGGGSGTAHVRAAAQRVPVAVIGRRASGTGADSVHTADAQGTRGAVDHLVALGHRRVRFVDGGRHPGAAERRRGYRAAMTRHGLDVDIVPGDHSEASGARAAEDLVGFGNDVSAVIASNDRCAVGVLTTLLRSGRRVPADCSIVGFDDSRLARLAHVDLTTVAQKPAEMAAAALRCVVERLGTRDVTPPRDIAIAPTLVVRGTTGPPAR